MKELVSTKALLCRDLPSGTPLDFSIGEGVITALLSVNNSLRSAYLRTLGGVDEPLSGEMTLLGVPLSTLTAEGWLELRRRVGFVMREAPLMSVLDALRNVALPALYHRMGSMVEIEKRARGLLDALGCEADLSLLPAYLSESERRQVAIARALILEPEILFLDDPLANLHGVAVRRAKEYLSQWVEERGGALVFASDDVRFVKEHADEILFIGTSGAQRFSSWNELISSDDPDVSSYLEEFQAEAAVLCELQT